MTEFNWRAHDKWLNPPDLHAEDGCAEVCHPYHVQERVLIDGCAFCEELKCLVCNGTGYERDGETNCLPCRGTGRILS